VDCNTILFRGLCRDTITWTRRPSHCWVPICHTIQTYFSIIARSIFLSCFTWKKPLQFPNPCLLHRHSVPYPGPRSRTVCVDSHKPHNFPIALCGLTNRHTLMYLVRDLQKSFLSGSQTATPTSVTRRLVPHSWHFRWINKSPLTYHHLLCGLTNRHTLVQLVRGPHEGNFEWINNPPLTFPNGNFVWINNPPHTFPNYCVR
jgi:hypothetical protein